jgi:ABC-type transport system substrate-binding protein
MDEGRRQEVSYRQGWTNGMNYAVPRGWGTLSQMRRFLHSTKGNYPGHTVTTLHPPIIDELLDKAFDAPDEKTQQDLIWQLQKTVFDEYALFSAIMITSNPAAESTKVMKSGYFEVYSGQFRPPTEMWLNK